MRICRFAGWEAAVRPLGEGGFAVGLGGKSLNLRLLESEGGLVAFEVAGRVVRAAVEVREDSVEVVLGGRWVGFLREGASSPPGREPAGRGGPGVVLAEISGKVTRLFVSAGDVVQPEQVLLIIEAMKMEHPVRAAAPARVESVDVNAGDQIAPGDRLLNLLPPD